MEKHFLLKSSSKRKRKVGTVLKAADNSSQNLPDILRTPSSRSRQDTLSSFSSLYYSASDDDSIKESKDDLRKTSFQIERSDLNFYTGISSIVNDNVSILSYDNSNKHADLNEDTKEDVTHIGNMICLDLGKKTLFATFKIVWVGDAGVGKTSLISVLMGNRFGLDSRPTLGVDFATKLVPGPDDSVVKLQFWDFSGQDRFRILSRAYFKGAQGCLMVFDTSRQDSFQQLFQWETQLRQQDYHGECFTMLLANKADLTNTVNDDEILDFVNRAKFSGWSRVSALNGTGITEVTEQLVSGLVRKEVEKRKSLDQNCYSCPDIFKLEETNEKADKKNICKSC